MSEPPDEARLPNQADLWILGNHRLLCGDSSSSPADWIVSGGRCDPFVCNTDPPYNVKVEPRSNNAIAAGLSSFSNDAASGRLKQGQGNAASFGVDHETGKPKHAATHKKLRPKDRPIANDFVSGQAFDKRLMIGLKHCPSIMLPGRCFYIWGGYANWRKLSAGAEEAWAVLLAAIIWDKHIQF